MSAATLAAVRPESSGTARGRVLPHNVDAEECVLGAMLLSRQAVLDAQEALASADFYRPRNGHIFHAIATVEGRGDHPDLVTVADELRRTGLLEMAGGEAELVRLQTETPTTSVNDYARIVAEHSQLRRLIAVTSEIGEAAYAAPPDVDGLVDRAQQQFFDAVTDPRRTQISSLAEVLGLGLDRIEAIIEANGALLGIPTGWDDLDDLFLGLGPGALYTVGSRPAMGKSAFALNLASHAAIHRNLPTLFVSLEMSEHELAQRILAAEAKVDSNSIRSGVKLTETDWARLNNAMSRLASSPLSFLCSSTVTLTELRSRARQLRARGQLDLLIVDYLQLMAGSDKSETRALEVAEISRGLKRLAGELQIPIVALAQVSRNVEHRADKRPTMADLKESGAIEADSDAVIFIYRDEVYNPDTSDRGMAEIIVAKHRQGPTATIKLAFLEHYAKFASLARSI